MKTNGKDLQLITAPDIIPHTFLDFPLITDLEDFDTDIAILGIPYGMPYSVDAMANEQSRAPDVIRQFTGKWSAYTRNHFDYDLGGVLLDGKEIKVGDFGNVTADTADHRQHYNRAEQVARKIFSQNTTLITLGGDHGVPIPVMRALDVFDQKVTIVHIDAHLDWRQEINGETDGFSSPLRRASEMPWVDKIIQIGMRGVGSARPQEVEAAADYGAKVIDAYTMHDIGINAVLDQIPEGNPYYITIDADGIDPTIMPAVLAPAPGGLSWIQLRKLIHGLVKKEKVLGMDLVEIAPANDVENMAMTHAERLICNFIGACVRAGYYD